MRSAFLRSLFVILTTLIGQLAASQPNIIFILVDDLGYGDLGSFYQNSRNFSVNRDKPAFATPHLDQMAAEGASLVRHYCGAPVCAPSRASLLLGVHQGHANVRDNQFDKALENNRTLGNVLRDAGYATAIVGKWGLQGSGSQIPEAHPQFRGFDYFYGYMAHLDGHHHYPKENGNDVWDGLAKANRDDLDKCYTADLWTARTKKWIVDQHAARPTQPFFVYLAYDTPHAELTVPTQTYPAGGGTSGGLRWTGTPGAMINTASGSIDSFIHPDYATATYDHDNNAGTAEIAWPAHAKRHATMVRRLDDCVADLIQTLKDLNIDNDTLVVFTSDNGPHNEAGAGTLGIAYDPTFFDSFGALDGIKRDTTEGGLRVPAIVRWPGRIPGGVTRANPSQFHDWMATFADLAEVAVPARCDGVSLVPSLTGIGTQLPGIVYTEYSVSGSTPNYSEFLPAHRGLVRNQQQVLWLGDYKGIRYNTTSHSGTPFKIHDVAADPQEGTDLSGQAEISSQGEFRDKVLQLRRANVSSSRPYDSEAVPAVALAPGTPGVSWKAHEQAFLWVPDFRGIAAEANGTTTVPSVSVRTRDDDIGLEFTGYLNVPADGDYTFYLSADTGAFLRLHQAQVLDADFGYSGGTEISSSLKLKAGMHPITLGYRRGTAGSPALALSWSGPSLAKQAIPASAFFVDGVHATPPPVRWPLDEGTGSTTSESKTSTTSDSFGTGVTWSADVSGPASAASLSFANGGGLGTNLDSAATGINGSGEKTIVAWIKTTTTAQDSFFGYSPTVGSGAGQDIRLLVNGNGGDTSGKLRVEVSSGGFEIAAGLNDGNWHMVAIVVNAGDGINDVDTYIDGTYTTRGSGGQLLNTATGGEIIFGSDGNASRHFSGLLDDVRIYDRALDEAELDALLAAMAVGPPDPDYATWIDGYFPGESDSMIIGIDADPDQDGSRNGIELLLGTNPSIAGDAISPTYQIGDTDFLFTFHRSDSAIAALKVVLQLGGDLVSWPATAEIQVGADTARSGPGVTITDQGSFDLVEILVPMSTHSRRFARVTAKLP